MKKAIYFIMFGILFAIPIIVKAEDCNVNELIKYQQLASNVVNSYDYVEIFNEKEPYGTVKFNVKLTNLNSKIYVVDNATNKRNFVSGTELEFVNIDAGTTQRYTLYVNGGDCNRTELLTIYVNIPPYNKYYKDKLCSNLEEYKVCNRWTKMDVTYDEFKKMVFKYIGKNTPIEEPAKKKTFEDIFTEIVAFLDKNKLKIFVPIIVISAGLMIYLIYLKKKDEFDLK